MLVVVYGTLKRGYHNNHLLTNAKFVTTGVVRGFKLYDSSFPVAAWSGGDCINVEVFDIGEPVTEPSARMTLSSLDMLEGYRKESPDTSMYHRQVVIVHTDDGPIDGQMYVGNPKFWKDFEHMREMGKDDLGSYQWP